MNNRAQTRRNFLKTLSLATSAVIIPIPLKSIQIFEPMNSKKKIDVVIVGGSYAGLSAAMALGRSLRSVLIIDSGKPCNQQTPRAHNFITHDGEKPKEISDKAKAQVLAYPTIRFLEDLVESVTKNSEGFSIATAKSQEFQAKKVLFATGVKDIMPNIKGFAECWGISVLHCPYCHGYEVANKNLGIIANGEVAVELCTLIQHWSKNLTLFTNGSSKLTSEQAGLLKKLNIKIIEKEIEVLKHNQGHLERIVFKDDSSSKIDAIFSHVAFEQNTDIPLSLGCQVSEEGYIQVDLFQNTNIEGVFCAGDNTTFLRAVPIAIAAGTRAGASINMTLLKEELPN